MHWLARIFYRKGHYLPVSIRTNYAEIAIYRALDPFREYSFHKFTIYIVYTIPWGLAIIVLLNMFSKKSTYGFSNTQICDSCDRPAAVY